MLDTELRTGIFKAVSPDGLASSQGFNDQGHGRSPGTWCREVRAVVGQDDVDLVRDCFNEMAQEVAGRASLGLAMELDIGEFARAIYGDEQIELAFGGLHLGDVDVEVADRVALELSLGRLLTLDLGQAADPVALQTAMQG